MDEEGVPRVELREFARVKERGRFELGVEWNWTDRVGFGLGWGWRRLRGQIASVHGENQYALATYVYV